MPANQSPALPYFSQPLPHPLRKCSFFNAAGVNVDGGDVFVMGWCNRCVARMATRRAGVISALFLIAVSSAPPVYSQVAAKVDPNRKAYDFTIRCFVAGAVANSDKRFNLNGANKAALDAGGKRAFDAAYIMGGKLGLSKQHISGDFDAYSRVYQRAFLKNDASFLRTRAACVKLGLM